MGSEPYTNESTGFPLYAGGTITAGQLIAIKDADGYA